MNVEIRVQDDDFSVAAEYDSLLARLPSGTGAVASFVGLVREMVGRDDVDTLFLEHYPGMTERSIGSIVAEAAQRWPLVDVLVKAKSLGTMPRFSASNSSHRASSSRMSLPEGSFFAR